MTLYSHRLRALREQGPDIAHGLGEGRRIVMSDSELIKMLIVSARPGRLDPVISSLREGGQQVRVASVDTEKSLVSSLHGDSWNCIVCLPPCPLGPTETLAILQKQHLDTPLVVILDEESVDQALPLLEQGASEVLEAEHLERLPWLLRPLVEGLLAQRETRRLELQLKELETRHRLLIDKSSDPVSYVQDGMHLYCNPRYAELFHHPDTDSIRTTLLLDLVAQADRPALKSLLADNTRAGSLTVQALCKDHSSMPVEMVFTPVLIDGRDCLQLTVHEATGNSEYAREKAQFENQDLLTRLHNRESFKSRLERAIGRAIREAQYSALLVVQLQDFDRIESVIGKAGTNQVLTDIGAFLQHSLGKEYVAARLGRDEFGLLIAEADADEVMELAELILSRINNRITSAPLPSLELKSDVGVALINDNARDADDMLNRARNNMRGATTDSQEHLQFPIAGSTDPSIDEMAGFIRQTLQNDQFKLLFQPIVNLKGESSQCYEVLLRLLDEEGNEVPPAAFISVANLHGLGEMLDQAVIDKVVELLASRKGDDLSMVINITPNTLVSRTFLPWLSDRLQSQKISGERLIFQVSEIDLYHDPDNMLAFCKGLDELGVRKGIEHFGCAVDPFKYMDGVNPRYVTLDESLMRDLNYSTYQTNNVKTLIEDLHRKHYQVIVPRVEDLNILPLLWEVGADLVQGYSLQRPSQQMDYEFVQEQEITLDAKDL